MAKFTKTNLATTIARLKIPKGTRDAQIFDEALAGFGIRKFESGKVSFFVKFNVGAQQRRMSLGSATPNRLKDARSEAEKILAQAKLGNDAQAEKNKKKKPTTSLGGLIPRFLAARESDVAAKYHGEMTRYLTEYWSPLHDYAVKAIERHDVVAVLDDIADERGKQTADHAKVALSSFFAWAIERGAVDTSPMLHIKRRSNGAGRDRVLSEHELAEVWHAVDDMGDYGAIVRLLIVSGQRRAEIADLTWPEIDFARKQIELPATRTKNKRAHIVPLSEPALDILDAVPQRARDFLFGEGRSMGFQGWSKAKVRLDTRLADIPAWTLHDIRRSVVTALNENGIAEPHIIEAVVNHVSGHRGGVAGVYNRSAYREQKRDALECWGEHVMGLVA